MLRQLNRLEKTRNFFILAFVIMMAVSLVFFYRPMASDIASGEVNKTLATVGSEQVTVGEVAAQKDALTRRFQGRLPVSTNRVLDGLISQRLLRQESARLGLTPTDVEVATEIRNQLKQANLETSDVEKYKQIAIDTAGSVKDFEQGIRDQLAIDKLRAFVTSGVVVSENDLVDDYKKRNTTLDLIYVPVTAQAFADKIAVTDADLQTYLNANKAKYFINEPQKKIQYLYLNVAKVGEKLPISDEELRAEYNALGNDKKSQGVSAQQLVLKVAKPELEQVVRAKADSLVEQARGKGEGGKISEEAFAEIVRGNSEDPNTAAAGGKLKGAVRRNPNKPDDPLQQILTLQEGEITEPIKFGSNYYIFRRGADVPKTFEDAKKEIEVSLRNRRAYKATADLATKASNMLKQEKDVRKVAGQIAAEANMPVSEIIRETPFIKPGDDVPNIGIAPQFEQGIADLNNVGDVGLPTSVKEGFAIPMLLEKREPRDPEFAEIKDKLTKDYQIEKAKETFQQRANELAAASDAAAFRDIAAKLGLKVEESKEFKIGSPLGVSGTNESLEDALFALTPNGVTKSAVKVGENMYVVAAATKRTDANMSNFAAEREQLFQSLAGTRKEQVFSDYLSSLRRRMETEGKIKVDKDALTKLKEEDETAMPQIPQMPPRR